jgi:RNA polymerase sigma-70 factor, ECF subfamily
VHGEADRGPALLPYGELILVKVDEAAVGQIFREEYGRSVASLIRAFGDIDFAEDVVQEAFAIALDRWTSDGLPPNPGAWITTTARNRAIDRLRRSTRGRELERDAGSFDQTHDESQETGPVLDDRLRLIFTCCHPALSTQVQIALTLRLLGGLTTADVASAFLVPEATMAKRLVRAKHKIKAARIPYRIPTEAEMVDRLATVLAVLYLIYNAGSSGPAGAELRREAIRLTRIIASLMPDEPEITGLLAALLLLSESRQTARFDVDGSIIRLADQDRTRWDRALIEEGHALLRACLRRDQPGPYQLQAAINAVHSDAPSIEATDWLQIVGLYDHLLEVSPTPVVALNRAIAVAEVRGPAAALALVDDLELDSYYLFHATRADLLRRLARTDDAAHAYARAAGLAPSTAERSFLEGRLADVQASHSPQLPPR